MGRSICSFKAQPCSYRHCLILMVVFCVVGLYVYYGILNGLSDVSTSKIMNVQVFQVNGKREAWCEDVPRLEPFHESIKHLVIAPPEPQCITTEFPLLFNATPNATIVPVKSLSGYRNLSILSCCYKVIKREWPDDVSVNIRRRLPDDRYSFSKICFPLSLGSETIIPKDHEFIAIYCQFNVTERKDNNGNGKDMKNWLGGNLNFWSREKSTTPVPQSVLIGAPSNKNGERIMDMFPFIHMKLEMEKSRVPEENRQSDAFGGEKMNVLILGLDSMSHMNFIRSFGKSHDFLVKNLSSLEMNWFNKVGINTYPCMNPMLTGKSAKEVESTCAKSRLFDTCPIIWKNFSERGYATLYAEDWPLSSIYNYLNKGFASAAPTDYYYRPFGLSALNLIGRENSTRNVAFQCLGPRLTFQKILNYVVSFVTEMEAHRKNYFGLMLSAVVTHDDINDGFWADTYLQATLKWLKDRLNNTLLIVMGDHGQRFGPIRKYRQGQLEDTLPLLHFVLPQNLKLKYARAFHNIWGNQNRLVTTYDLHETLIDILEAQDKLEDLIIKRREEHLKREALLPRGISLFLPVPSDRSCTQAAIPHNFCACNKMTPVQVTQVSVQLAVTSALDYINKLVRADQKCATLQLVKVVSAFKLGGGDGKIGWEGYQVSFVTMPGNASFQALVIKKRSFGPWEVSGTIERINRFGVQSSCVKELSLKQYCYCRNQS